MLCTGHTYTLKHLFNLDLTDVPSLSVVVEGKESPIQHSHMTVSDFLDQPEWGETKWVFLFTTHEEIPCFVALNNQEVLKLVTVEEPVDNDLDYWVVPKSHPREQYGSSK